MNTFGLKARGRIGPAVAAVEPIRIAIAGRGTVHDQVEGTFLVTRNGVLAARRPVVDDERQFAGRRCPDAKANSAADGSCPEAVRRRAAHGDGQSRVVHIAMRRGR